MDLPRAIGSYAERTSKAMSSTTFDGHGPYAFGLPGALSWIGLRLKGSSY